MSIEIEFGKIYKWERDYFVPFRRIGNVIKGIDLKINCYDWESAHAFSEDWKHWKLWKLCDPESIPENIRNIFFDPLFEIESLRKIPEKGFL